LPLLHKLEAKMHDRVLVRHLSPEGCNLVIVCLLLCVHFGLQLLQGDALVRD